MSHLQYQMKGTKSFVGPWQIIFLRFLITFNGWLFKWWVTTFFEWRMWENQTKTYQQIQKQNNNIKGLCAEVDISCCSGVLVQYVNSSAWTGLVIIELEYFVHW